MRPYTSKLASFDEHGLRRLLRCARVGLAMRPDKVRQPGRRLVNRPGSDEQLTAKLAAIWRQIRRRGWMERIMEDERKEDAETEPDNVLGMCGVEGCTGEALRDGICKRHLLKLATRGDPEAAEAVRRWHAVHDRRPETPHETPWRHYPKEDSGKQEPPTTSSKENTMANEKTCPRCGRTFKTAHALACHLGHSQCGDSDREATAKQPRPRKRPCGICGVEFDARVHSRHEAKCRRERGLPAAAGAAPGPTFPVPRLGALRADSAASPAEPPDGIAAVGHAATRLIQLIGLGEHLADFPHPAGHVFVNTTNGKAAVVTPDGEIRPAEVVMGVMP